MTDGGHPLGRAHGTLGWGLTERPSVSVVFGGGWGIRHLEGGSGTRRTFDREQERGAWIQRPEGGSLPPVPDREDPMTVEAPPKPTLADVLAAWAAVTGARAVDLFAGPGGWDLAALTLGLEVLGVEWDDAACATRGAAGLRTLQGDVSALDPAAFGPVKGLIGSPPCPTFSRAGGGSGKHLTDVIVGCMRALMRGDDTRQLARDEAYAILLPIAWEAEQAKARKATREPDRAKAEASARRDADMSVLVVEPLRWALKLEPSWITLEQVPDVLGLWKVVADLLREVGYSCWTGILEAERYGVPQTRERAVLIARRDGHAHPPIATHQRYDPRVPRLEHPELTLEGEVQPWVSMADAIAYGMTARPGFTVRAGKSPLEVMDGGAAAREAILEAEASGEWRQRSNYNDGATDDRTRRDLGEPSTSITGRPPQWERTGQARDSGPGAERDSRSMDDPSYTVRAEGSGSHPSGVRWDVEGLEDVELVNGAQANQARRSVDEPAPTIVGGHDTSNRRWEGTLRGPDEPQPWEDRPATTIVGGRRSEGGMLVGRQLPPGEDRSVGGWSDVPDDDPRRAEVPKGAAGDPEGLKGDDWPERRPATTVAGDPRVFQPGGHHGTGEQSKFAVRVTVAEAGVLQTFPADYPWQGPLGKQYQQVGNAVPPLLALRTLEAATDAVPLA